jgi:hypothetical protein
VVTHLISTEARGVKYKVASQGAVRTPVLTPKWIDRVWADAQRNVDSALVTSKDYIAAFALPCFAGMHFCLSGYTAERDLLRKLIVTHGGAHSGLALRMQPILQAIG